MTNEDRAKRVFDEIYARSDSFEESVDIIAAALQRARREERGRMEDVITAAKALCEPVPIGVAQWPHRLQQIEALRRALGDS